MWHAVDRPTNVMIHLSSAATWHQGAHKIRKKRCNLQIAIQ